MIREKRGLLEADIKINQIKWTMVGRPELKEKEDVKDNDKVKPSSWNMAADPNYAHVLKAAEEIAKNKKVKKLNYNNEIVYYNLIIPYY